MKILWLNAGLLLPLDKGGKLRTWHLMRYLARRHAITYLSFADPDQRPEDLEGMREVAGALSRDEGDLALAFAVELRAGLAAHMAGSDQRLAQHVTPGAPAHLTVTR